jgi:hypothetical protein
MAATDDLGRDLLCAVDIVAFAQSVGLTDLLTDEEREALRTGAEVPRGSIPGAVRCLHEAAYGPDAERRAAWRAKNPEHEEEAGAAVEWLRGKFVALAAHLRESGEAPSTPAEALALALCGEQVEGGKQ